MKVVSYAASRVDAVDTFFAIGTVSRARRFEAPAAKSGRPITGSLAHKFCVWQKQDHESERVLRELKRRNVIRMAGLYLIGAWLVVQVAGTVLPMFGTPEWLPRTIVVLLVIGFVPAVIFSWVFELTPEDLKRDEDVASGARSAAIRALKKSSLRSRRKNRKAQPAVLGKGATLDITWNTGKSSLTITRKSERSGSNGQQHCVS